MKNFRTTFKIPSFPFKLSHQDQILSIGSCFAENIGSKLEENKFQILLNPFGILYNPSSVTQTLERIFNNEKITGKDILQHNDLWHSRLHHTRFSQADKSTFLEDINANLKEANTFLQTTNCLLITLGTAFVWEEKETGIIVANCHKRPQKLFTRRRLSISEIKENLLTVLRKIKKQNIDLQVIMTVSPVRHTNDGFIENQRSKAALILAIDELCQAENFIHYFPAYELIQDDLRDYRFYASDMLHPNEVAVDYVWEHFKDTLFTAQTEGIFREIEKLKAASAHRPFQIASSAHQAFLQTNLQKIEGLEKRFSFLNFSIERQIFEKQLNSQ
jgi:hypothetical protein